MIECLETSLTGSLLISLCAYGFGDWLKRKTGKSWCNPLLIACICVVLFLVMTGLSYANYKAGTKLLTDLLTPATVCLAIPLYKQVEVLKKNALAIAAGVVSGVLITFLCVTAVALLFHLSKTQYVTMMPKSVTTAIGMALSSELGGIESVTVAAILITGIWGNVTAPLICKLFRITHPVAKGIGIGASCHVIGTARAMEMGPVEGAMSSLSTVVSGLLTALLLPLIANL